MITSLKHYTLRYKIMRIVGSMTTLPGRLKHIEIVIRSIMNQTRQLDAFYLHIPHKTKKGQEYNIPNNFLHEYNVTINRCDEDYGPITKLVPILDVEKDPDTCIVTFDDDMYVKNNVVKLLERGAKKYPKSCIGFSGGSAGSFPFYLHFIYQNQTDMKVDWLQGTHTILYRRWMVDKDILQNINIPYIDDNDDHRIGGYLGMKKIDKVVLSGNALDLFKVTTYSRIQALSARYQLPYEWWSMCMNLKKMGYYHVRTPFYYSIFFEIIVGIVYAILVIILSPSWLITFLLLIQMIVLAMILYHYYQPIIIVQKNPNVNK